jgi:hypothetical protein
MSVSFAMKFIIDEKRESSGQLSSINKVNNVTSREMLFKLFNSITIGDSILQLKWPLRALISETFPRSSTA